MKTEKNLKNAESQEVREEKEVRLQPGPKEDEEEAHEEMQPEDRKVSKCGTERYVSMLANVS